MKRNYKILVAIIALSACLYAFKINSEPTFNPEKDKMLLELLSFVIEKGHFDPKDIDDTFSKGVYKDFVLALDPSKRFLLQSDIDELSKFELLIDDAIKNKDLTFFNLAYDRLMNRTEESKKYYTDILAKPFDYNIDEDLETDYEKTPYCKSTSELKDKWRKQIKLSTLSNLTDKLKFQQNKNTESALKTAVIPNEIDPETLELSAEDKKVTSANGTPKSFEILEKETRESATKQLNDYYSFVKDLTREDWFAVFVNAIAERFDPHTSYFAPEAKEKFDVEISGTFFGIGARLQKKNDYTEITELISGGPAWRQKELEAGDVILKVGQGSAEPVDVVGMKINDVVKKIKGPKDTEVKLTVKKVSDNSIKVISIIRAEVEIEETYAKSSIVNKNGKLYGIIYLPKFYINFDNKDNRDAAKDIALEIERLKEQGIEGLTIDLRDNGGGSLKTVVDIAGLFINQGPVVQVKSTGKSKEILSDKDPKIQWEGPLVIMINNFSASASEILAAAMQDYKRGIIIGSKQSYGKGTVQTVIDFNQFVRNSDFGDLGALKTTTQKFYRINGGSTQLRGVASDVVMLDKFSYIDIGERDSDNALPWDKIDAAPFTAWNKNSNFEKAIVNSNKRLSESNQFKLIDQNAKWLSKRRNDTKYSLNIDNYKKAQAILNSESSKFKAINNYKGQLIFNSLPYENEIMEKDVVLKEKRKRWHESLNKDAYVEEALYILDDLQSSPIIQSKLPSKDKKAKTVGSL